jgi:hypothetical protein
MTGDRTAESPEEAGGDAAKEILMEEGGKITIYQSLTSNVKDVRGKPIKPYIALSSSHIEISTFSSQDNTLYRIKDGFLKAIKKSKSLEAISKNSS